jgi:hypothetical protein
MRIFVSTAFVLTLSLGSAIAHPGHGDPAVQDGFVHYVASPIHFIPVICMAVAAAAITLMIRHHRKQQVQPIHQPKDVHQPKDRN